MTTPAASWPLYESASVTLDGSGNGSVRLGPVGPRELWQPTTARVSASSNTAEASCKVYAGPAAQQQYYVDGTLSGSTGDSTDAISGYVIGRTQSAFVWAVWAGGDAGANATLIVAGTKSVG